LSTPRVIVVGAGIGGLVAALDLVGLGLQVTVIEQADHPGGKMREIDIQGRRIDSGPTVFTMPWVFEEIFADAGSAIDEELEVTPAEILASHAWQGGGRLDLYADMERSAEAIAELAGHSDAERYREFCAQAERVYRTLYQPFMRNQRPSPPSLIAASGLRGLVDLWRIRPFESLWDRLGKCFRDARLRALFGRYATYCGSSPLQAPATLMLIAHVEQCGVWKIDGGMRRLADALANLIERKGGEIRYETAVAEIDVKGGRVSGVELANGERLAAEAVVANADVASIRQGMLGRQATSAVAAAGDDQRSLSAVTFSILGETRGFELTHHNVFFPDDYPREFQEIFEHARLPAQPAVYVCAQDRGPGVERPVGRERLFLITNAPPSGDRDAFDRDRIAGVESAVYELLQDCGLTIESREEHRIATTPRDFESLFPGSGGALYGAAAHGWRATFKRPAARSRIAGLYLAGGSVHPGPGVPMVAISGRLAAEAIASDLGLAPADTQRRS